MTTIVVYHYVRDVAASRYPRLKALAIDRFERQLDYLQRHYQFVGGHDVAAGAQGRATLPPNACWLTFDDGLADHVDVVAPRLLARGIPASFFATVQAARRERLLTVHKTQFLRASADASVLIEAIRQAVAPLRAGLNLPADDELYATYSKQWDLWDPPEQVFVKSFLQKGLPEPHRSQVLDALFARFVTADQVAFAEELYAGAGALARLAAEGFEVGGHGYSHEWLGTLPPDAQRVEIERTRDFLASLPGALSPDGWAMCYPHGSHTGDTKAILREFGCTIGLGLRTDVIDAFTDPFDLPRLDTNDLPAGADAAPNGWTQRLQQVHL